MGLIRHIAREIDELEHRSIGVPEIDARTVHHAALSVLFADQLHSFCLQPLDGALNLVRGDCEGVVHAFRALKDRIHRRVLLHQDETYAACIDEGHVPLGRREQVLAADDVETISIWSPSYLIVLLEYIRSHRNALIEEWSAGQTVQEGMVFRMRRPSPDRLTMLTHDPIPWNRLWPSLKLISCWDDPQPSSSASYLRRTFPDIVLQGKGLFSTEAPMTVPIIPAYGCAPIVTELFFEFVDEAGRISRLHELEQDKTYSVIFSQVNGFTRYRIGDRVKVSGYYERTPCLDFIGREGIVCDLVGEKLHEQCVKEAIGQLPLADSRFQMLIPMPFPDGPSRYLLLLDKLEADAEDVSRRLDELLQGSYRYREARLMGQLNVPKVLVTADAQERCLEYFARRGMRWGNIKHTYLVRNPQDGRALAEGLGGR